MSKHDDPAGSTDVFVRVEKLASSVIDVAKEIQAEVNLALAQQALTNAAAKTPELIENVEEMRRLLREIRLAARTDTPETPEDTT